MVTALSKLLFNGIVYTFDYGIFQPDGAYYSVYALRLTGENLFDSAFIVENWYSLHSVKNSAITVNLLMDTSGDIWKAILMRPLYPILSAPFVLLFGMYGMLVIPFVSFFLILIYIQRVFKRESLALVGLAFNLILCSSPTIARWMLLNYPDGLLVLVLILYSYHFLSEQKKSFTYISVILILLSTQIRFCWILWIMLSVHHIIKNEKMKAFKVFIFSSVFSLPAVIYAPKTALLPNESESNFLEKIVRVPFSAFKTLFVEFSQLLMLDKMLLMLVLLGLLVGLSSFRKSDSQLFVMIFVGCLIISGLNGVYGVNFRYYLPMIPFLATLLARNYKNPLK
jgi:hypothetical protein